MQYVTGKLSLKRIIANLIYQPERYRLPEALDLRLANFLKYGVVRLPSPNFLDQL